MQNKVLKKIVKKLKLDSGAKIERDLRRISIDVDNYIKKENIIPRITILWGPSFNFEFYSLIHNVLIVNALKVRGVEIIPLSCKSVQYIECTCSGGDYAGYGKSGYLKRREKICKFCQKQDEKIFQKICGLNIVGLSNFISIEEKNKIINKVSKIEDIDIYNYVYDEIDFGSLIKDVTLNNYLSGTLDELQYKYESGKNYLISALILHKTYQRVLEKYKIDRVITSGGDYFQFILLRILANRKKIPTYHYNYAGRAGTWTYALNEASNNMNFLSSWKKFQKSELNQEQNEKLDSYLKFRFDGANTDVLSYVNESKIEFNDLKSIWTKYDNSKPVVLLAANMVWDAAALNKEIFFNNMFEWTIETIRHFMKHSEWQLIVKPHPAESHTKLRKTKQTLLSEIRKANLKLTDNILVLESDTKISPYDIYNFCDLGLIFTSTVGIELAMLGKPVIVAGKTSFWHAGFTIDPITKQEYFDKINEYLTCKDSFDHNHIAQLSRKYFYLYHFHYLIDNGIGNYKWGELPQLKIKSFKEILPGANKYIDYITESIINNLPIVSEDRWPPES
ncbi:MAG: hypothetical protein STSR0008_12200 [Ignavibacterium sp.]